MNTTLIPKINILLPSRQSQRQILSLTLKTCFSPKTLRELTINLILIATLKRMPSILKAIKKMNFSKTLKELILMESKLSNKQHSIIKTTFVKVIESSWPSKSENMYFLIKKSYLKEKNYSFLL